MRNTDNNKVGVSSFPPYKLSLPRHPGIHRCADEGGKVEGEAQGPPDMLHKFLKDVDNGPIHAHVVRLDKEERGVIEGDENFVVRR